MDEFDLDLDQAKRLKQRKKEKEEKEFSKLINKKDLNSFELDEMFSELE